MNKIINALRAYSVQRSYRRAQRIMLNMGRKHGGEWHEQSTDWGCGPVAESLSMAGGTIWAMTQDKAVDIDSARRLMAYVRTGGDGAVMIG